MKAFASIKKLLCSRRTLSVNEGIEAALTHEDETVMQRILEGTTYQLGGQRPVVGRRSHKNQIRDVIGRIVPGTMFESSSTSLLWDEWVCLQLLSQVEHPLREEITHLDLTNIHYGSRFPLDLDGLHWLPAVKALNLYIGHDTFVELGPVGAMENLRWLTIEERLPGRLRDWTLPPLDQLEELHIKARKVVISSAKNLRKITGASEIQESPVLPSISELHAVALTDELVGIAPNLEVLRCSKLGPGSYKIPICQFEGCADGSPGPLLEATAAQIPALARLNGLKLLAIKAMHPEPDLPVDALLDCKDLRVLDVRRPISVDELRALASHPSLRFIRVTDATGVCKEDIPPSIKKIVSFAKKPDFLKAAADPVAKTKSVSKTASAVDRKVLARLKKLLTTPEAGAIVQGVELTASLETPELFETLLAGVTYTEDDASVNDGARKYKVPVQGRLVPNKLFTGSGSRQHWLDLSMSLLLAASDLPLRSEVKGLTLGQRYYSQTPLIEFPYQGLADLPGLERLELILDAQTKIDFSGLPLLKKLKLLSVTGFRNVEKLPGHDNVEVLEGVLDLDENSSWPMLETLEIDSEQAVLSGDRFPKIETLLLIGKAELFGLPAIKSIQAKRATLSIKSCPRLRSITGDRVDINELDIVPALERVEVRSTAGRTLSAIAPIDSISTMEIRNITMDGEITIPKNAATTTAMGLYGNAGNLGNFGQLKGLQQLTIAMKDAPLSLESLRDASELRVLDIRGCVGITCLEPLKNLKELRMIAVKNSGVVEVPENIKHLVSRAANPDTGAARVKPLRKKPKKSKIPVADVHRSEWEQVVSGLAVEDIAIAFEAADRAIAIGIDAIEHLLSKAKIEKNRLKTLAPFRLTQPGLAASVVSRLLQAAPESSAHAKRLQRASILEIQGGRKKVIVQDLSGFSSLKHLCVEKGYSVMLNDIEQSGLETLFVQAYIMCEINGELPLTLKRALFSRSAPPLEQLAGSGLKDLYLIPNSRINIKNIDQCVGLTRLFLGQRWVAYNVEGLDALSNIPLTELTVSDATDLSPLIYHPTLQTINVFKRAMQPAPVPNELEHLVETTHSLSSSERITMRIIKAEFISNCAE